MLVDVFAPEFRDQKNLHLKNFYMILPPLVSEALLSLGNSYKALAAATKLFVKKPKNLQKFTEKPGERIIMFGIVHGSRCTAFQPKREKWRKNLVSLKFFTLRQEIFFEKKNFALLTFAEISSISLPIRFL